MTGAALVFEGHNMPLDLASIATTATDEQPGLLLDEAVAHCNQTAKMTC